MSGAHSAVVWHHGRTRFDPDTYDNEVDHPARPRADFPINAALRHRRSTEAWYAGAFSPVRSLPITCPVTMPFATARGSRPVPGPSGHTRCGGLLGTRREDRGP